MEVTLLRSYTNKKGNKTYVYEVDGLPHELAAYKFTQSDFYRENREGKPLWFTSLHIGDTSAILINGKGKVVPDLTKVQNLDEYLQGIKEFALRLRRIQPAA